MIACDRHAVCSEIGVRFQGAEESEGYCGVGVRRNRFAKSCEKAKRDR